MQGTVEELPSELIYLILTMARPLDKVRAFMSHHVERTHGTTANPYPELPLEDLFDKWRKWPPREVMPEVQFRGLIQLAGYEIHVMDEPAIVVGVKWRSKPLTMPKVERAKSTRKAEGIPLDDDLLGRVKRAARANDTFRGIARALDMGSSTFTHLRRRHPEISQAVQDAWGAERFNEIIATAERRSQTMAGKG